VLPVNAERNDDGRGLCGRNWPAAQEIPWQKLRNADLDLVVLQRPEEIELATQWLGKRPGIDIPAVYVEHNAPRPYPDSVHPLADRDGIPLIHVTDFNRLMWNNGSASTRVINHGIADPGHLYSGEIPAAATMINEPCRRWRTVGADLLAELSLHTPIDVWGIGSEMVTDRHGMVRGRGDVAPPRLLHEVAARRVYLHTARWTSLGLSLIEAMYLGMPIVAVASTMAPLVVPAEAGVVSADVETLGRALEAFVADPSAAAAAGKAARDYAVAHFSLQTFLDQWDDVIRDVCGPHT
jgi:glycosyltransferase involved in cell wall biosynthesis